MASCVFCPYRAWPHLHLRTIRWLGECYPVAFALDHDGARAALGLA